MSNKRKYLEHYFRMIEMCELEGIKHIIKDEPNETKRQLLLSNIPLNYYDYNIENILLLSTGINILGCELNKMQIQNY